MIAVTVRQSEVVLPQKSFTVDLNSNYQDVINDQLSSPQVQDTGDGDPRMSTLKPSVDESNFRLYITCKIYFYSPVVESVHSHILCPLNK